MPLKTLFRLATLLALSWLGLAGCTRVEAQPPGTPVPMSYFGLHAHRLVLHVPSGTNGILQSPWPSFPFGSLRLWDAYVTWPHLQPERNRWNFSTLDQHVGLAAQKGIRLVVPLGLSPAWASARPEEKSNYAPGNAAEPASLDDWRLYVRIVAERYKGRVEAYELWNEVNYKGFYSGDLTSLVTLARIAHEEVKRVDPAALMLSPSFTGSKGPEWLDRYLTLGGDRYADVISYHFYTPEHSPEAIFPVVQQVRAVLRKHGLQNKPLWNSETGWWLTNLVPTPRMGAAAATWLELDQQTSAAFVARAFLLGWAAGLDRYYWYAWDNRDMGLYDVNVRAEKPASKAYAQVVRWMAGNTMKECTQNQSIWICTLYNAQGKRLNIVWQEGEVPRKWEVPADWSGITVERLSGETAPNSGTVELSSSPVLIR